MLQRKYLRLVGIWICLILAIVVSYTYNLDKKGTTFLVIVFGFITQAFTGLVSVIALVPIIGPVIAKVLSWPLFLTLNGIAYLVTLVVIGKGDKKRVIESRILVSAFLVGIIIGFILGRVF